MAATFKDPKSSRIDSTFDLLTTVIKLCFLYKKTPTAKTKTADLDLFFGKSDDFLSIEVLVFTREDLQRVVGQYSVP